jgi:Acetyltransferases, including N-acetylases of ribosomal proteins
MRNLLSGENIQLTALREGEEAVLEKWFNNIEFLRNYDMVPSVPQEKRGIDELMKYYRESNERYIMAVRLKKDGQLIGISGFDDIIWANGTAFMFIGIGESECQGRGFGREALQLLIDYGFNELNFHKIQLNVIEYNDKAVKLYEKAGFVREGIYREYIYRDGRRYHMYLYGMLKSEWNR